MQTRILRTFLFLAALLTGSAIAGMAQSYVSEGKGSFTIKGEASELVRAGVTFTNDGKFIASMEMADKTKFQFKGDYRGSAPRRGIVVSDALGRRGASGTGNITLSDDKSYLRGVYISGKVPAGDEFIVTFVANGKGQGGSDSDSGFSLTDSTDTNGRLELANKNRQVRRVEINMMRNGELTIRISGPELAATTYRGRWSGAGPEYKIDLRVVDRTDVRAKGTLKLGPRKKHLASVEVEGKQGQDNFRLYAEPK